MTAAMALVRRDDGQLVIRHLADRPEARSECGPETRCVTKPLTCGQARPGDIPATPELVAALIGDTLPPDQLAARIAEHQMRAHMEQRGQSPERP